MSRSAITIWTQRVQKRLARATGELPLTPSSLEAALLAVARKLRIDPIVLLGALAAKPSPASLWNDVLQALQPQPAPRDEDWTAIAAAAEAVTAAFAHRTLASWVVEPALPADVFVLAACLATHTPSSHLEIVATHSDPRMVELGRCGLVPEATLLRAPDELRGYFRHLGRCWQVSPELRGLVRFESVSPCDLPGVQRPASSDGFQLIVSRGRLARLDRTVARRVARRLCGSLCDDGFLLLGPGDHDDRLFGELEPYVAPGVLLYRQRAGLQPLESIAADFAALLAAVEAHPTGWEPRWQLACLLLREGYAESAIAHLRELARWRPDFAEVWHVLSKAHTLAGDRAAAAEASSRALLAAAPGGAPKLLM